MQNNKFHYCLHILPILFFMAFVSASCIKDDQGDRPDPGTPSTPGFSLQVKAFDADGGSLGDETIKDLTLYIFDAGKALLDTRNVLLSETVTLDYPGHDNLTLVAWGNGKQGAQSMPALKEGDHLETAFVSLARRPVLWHYGCNLRCRCFCQGIPLAPQSLRSSHYGAPPQRVCRQHRRRVLLHRAQNHR